MVLVKALVIANISTSFLSQMFISKSPLIVLQKRRIPYQRQKVSLENLLKWRSTQYQKSREWGFIKKIGNSIFKVAKSAAFSPFCKNCNFLKNVIHWRTVVIVPKILYIMFLYDERSCRKRILIFRFTHWTTEKYLHKSW